AGRENDPDEERIDYNTLRFHIMGWICSYPSAIVLASCLRLVWVEQHLGVPEHPPLTILAGTENTGAL
ncbi:hypothetical protein ACOIFA_28860, partial [Klebsiella pneumoniae]|uniref:hypothetical protein n=1 Tax=Klebsiella pneumoniae TaxID=573 RepID=UPI003B5987C7